MKRTLLWPVAICAGFALGACGTVDGNQTSNSSQSDDDDDDDDDDDTESGTGLVPTTGNPTATGDSSGGFIVELDNGGMVFECDMFAQDCQAGEKCMPWANDGGNVWNATRCSEIEDNPGQPGDECTVQGTGTSGLDDCDVGSMCWDVDGETNIGTCIAMCTGNADAPICDDPDTDCGILNDGALVLCLPNCDPLLQDCAEGQACYPVGGGAFSCGPDASGEMGLFGDPCEFVNVCDAGLFCATAGAVPGCTTSMGCCSEYCDIEDPTGDAQCSGAGQMCVPWDPPPGPGLEEVGACVIPA